MDWGRNREWSFTPFTVLDVGSPSYCDARLPVFVEVMADRVACVAFPAEAAAEMRDERGSTLDDPGNDTMPVPQDEDLSKAVDREKDLLDAMPLPGTPVDEAERRRSWMTLPLRVRTAIRRMHPQFGQPSSTVLVQILRTARAPPEYIQACRHFRCDACEDNKPKHQATKVALPKDYVFVRESRHRCSGNQGRCRRTLPVLEHSRLGYYFPTSSIAATGTRFAVQPRVLGQLCQFVGRLGWLATNLEL